MSVVALVPAAGRGERLGASIPKALVRLHGRPLVWHAVTALLDSGSVDSVVVSVPPAELESFRVAVPEAAVTVVPGGCDRTASVRLALAVADPACDVVLVHDAARCLAPPSLTVAVVDAVRGGAGAVVPVLAVPDTLKQVDAAGHIVSTVDRTVVRAVQTPQGFAADLLRRAHTADNGAVTDDAGLVERLGETVHTVPGHPHAFKITTPLDLTVAEALLVAR